MATFDEIKQRVVDTGGVCTVAMMELRDANGSGKLGVHVVAEIKRALASRGLGHIPVDLPGNQHDLVRLYARGSRAGDFIEKVVTPHPAQDASIVGEIGGADRDLEAVLQKIRELVAE